MERYLVFADETYYPNGGMNDFVGSSDSLVDAIGIANRQTDQYDNDDVWANILDTSKRCFIEWNKYKSNWSDWRDCAHGK